MNTKTKTALAIGVIFILTAIVVGFYVQQKKEIAKIESENQAVGQNQEKNGLNPNEESISKIQIVSTVSSGTITSIKDKTVEVKTEKENIILNIQDKTSVYSMDGKEAVIKSVSDLKEGTEITFEYDIKTRDAIAISLAK